MLKSNTKVFREGMQRHILSFYDSPEDLIRDMRAGHAGMPKSYPVTPWKMGEYLVDGGCFLCYTNDVRAFLKEMFQESQEQADKYEAYIVWGHYKAYCARACEEIYNGKMRV